MKTFLLTSLFIGSLTESLAFFAEFTVSSRWRGIVGFCLHGPRLFRIYLSFLERVCPGRLKQL